VSSFEHTLGPSFVRYEAIIASNMTLAQDQQGGADGRGCVESVFRGGRVVDQVEVIRSNPIHRSSGMKNELLDLDSKLTWHVSVY
jgi:hypothetical protein